jgi:DNA repair protein RadD
MSGAPTLRDYQEAGVAGIRACFAAGARRVLYQAPTGSGKTVLFSYIVANAVARGNRVVILGHRIEIVDQISQALTAFGVPHGIIAAGHPETPERPVQVASVMTLVRRLDRMLPPALVVVDEAHHAVAGTWTKILAALPDARVLGVTATPERLDGKGLKDVFETLVLGPAPDALIKADFLSGFTAFAPSRSPDLSGIKTRMGDFAIGPLADVMSAGVIVNRAVDEYKKLCAGVPAIAFCVDIAHSMRVAAAFAARGYRAGHVDGETPADERRALITALATGEIQILCNCGLISEGLDVPAVVAAILLRPTKSLALYLQQVGRALRPAPGKTRALILDHAGNTFRFGLADAPRDWSLEGRAKRNIRPVHRCPECGAINPIDAFECSECGQQLREPPSPARQPVRLESIGRPLEEMSQADRIAAMSYRQCLTWAGTNEARLNLVAQARGYKRGWVWHRLQEPREARA